MRKNKEAIVDQSPGADLAVASNGKSRKTRAGFATLAVLGLGAGLTLAAFTGNVNFGGTVNAHEAGSKFLLQTAITSTGGEPREADGDQIDADEWSYGDTISSDLNVAVGTASASSHPLTLWVRDSVGQELTSVKAGDIATDAWPDYLTIAPVGGGTQVVFTETESDDGAWSADVVITVKPGTIADGASDATWRLPVTADGPGAS